MKKIIWFVGFITIFFLAADVQFGFSSPPNIDTFSGMIEPPSPPITSTLRIGLEIVSGNNQEGLVGRCAKNPLVVRAC